MCERIIGQSVASRQHNGKVPKKKLFSNQSGELPDRRIRLLQSNTAAR